MHPFLRILLEGEIALRLERFTNYWVCREAKEVIALIALQMLPLKLAALSKLTQMEVHELSSGW